MVLEPRTWRRSTTQMLSSVSPACYSDSLQKLGTEAAKGESEESTARENTVKGIGVGRVQLKTRHGAVSLWCPRPPPTLAAAQTPRPHPGWPQETWVLSKLSFPEQSPCFPNLPGKGGRQHRCFPSPPGLSEPTAVHCASYGWPTDTLNTHVCDKRKVREE